MKRELYWEKKGTFSFKSPMIETEDFDFSFSGLKTQVSRELAKIKEINGKVVDDACFSVQNAIVKVLVKKTIKAAKQYKTSTIVMGGGVSANQALRDKMQLEAIRYLPDAKVHFPPLRYTTDNAAMIASYALFNPYFQYWHDIKAEPELYFDS